MLFEVPHRVGVELDIFEKAHELDRLAGDEVLQRLQRRIDRRTRPRDRVPMRARRRLTQHGEHPSFDLGRDARLETVRFLVCEVPRHLQDVGEEPLGETVLTHRVLGDGEAVRRQRDRARVALDEPHLLQARNLLGDACARHAESARDARLDDALSFFLELVDRFEVVLDAVGFGVAQRASSTEVYRGPQTGLMRSS